MIIYVVVDLSYDIAKRSATHYQLYESDSKTTLMLAVSTGTGTAGIGIAIGHV